MGLCDPRFAASRERVYVAPPNVCETGADVAGTLPKPIGMIQRQGEGRKIAPETVPTMSPPRGSPLRILYFAPNRGGRNLLRQKLELVLGERVS